MSCELALLGGSKTVTLPFPPYPVIGAEETAAVVQTLLSGQLSQVTKGGVVAEMELAYADYFGAKFCHSYNSGTAAIHSALFAVGVKPGDEVLTASNTWISGINAICHAGAVPVFCDVAPNAQYIDPEEIRRKAGPNTRAVIVTHLWGVPADMDAILAAAREKNLYVIEDCSHAHGGKYKGRYLGTIGDVGAFSLQGSKAIVASEGGFLLTDNELWYQRSSIPGDHGIRLKTEITAEELEPFSHGGGAWTYRITPMCAAIALAQLRRLETLNAARQANYDQLQQRLARSVPFITWPELDEGSVRGWYSAPALYTYDQDEVARDLFVDACQAEGAGVRGCGYANWYEIPLFQDPSVYGQLFTVEHTNGVEFKPVPPGSLEHNEQLRQRQLLFPVPAERCLELMDQIATAVEKVAHQMAKLAEHKAVPSAG